jgi:hypothetical protein
MQRFAGPTAFILGFSRQPTPALGAADHEISAQ